MSLQSLKSESVVNTFLQAMGCQDQKDKPKETKKIGNMEETNWETEIKLSDNHNK